MLNKYNKENMGINFNSEFIFYIRNLNQKNAVLESSSEIEIEECIFEGFDDNYQAVTFFFTVYMERMNCIHSENLNKDKLKKMK